MSELKNIPQKIKDRILRKYKQEVIQSEAEKIAVERFTLLANSKNQTVTKGFLANGKNEFDCKEWRSGTVFRTFMKSDWPINDSHQKDKYAWFTIIQLENNIFIFQALKANREDKQYGKQVFTKEFRGIHGIDWRILRLTPEKGILKFKIEDAGYILFRWPREFEPADAIDIISFGTPESKKAPAAASQSTTTPARSPVPVTG